jgi:hypothetical protein
MFGTSVIFAACSASRMPFRCASPTNFRIAERRTFTVDALSFFSTNAARYSIRRARESGCCRISQKRKDLIECFCVVSLRMFRSNAQQHHSPQLSNAGNVYGPVPCRLLAQNQCGTHDPVGDSLTGSDSPLDKDQCLIMAPPHPFLAPGGSRSVLCVTFRPPLAGLRWMEPQIEVVREVRGWLGRSKRRSGD